MKLDITSVSNTDMENGVENFTIPPRNPEGVSDLKETEYLNTKFTQYFAYYKEVPEYKSALDKFADWVVGKGWTCSSNKQKDILSLINGWGEDTLQSILWNLIVTKKIGGDAFAEIIRDPENGRLLNLKPLDPSVIRIVVNGKGRIERYEQIAKNHTGKSGEKIKAIHEFKPRDILHLCNGRVLDEIHGTSITESIEWVILSRNEAMRDKRKNLHRSLVRIMEVDEDDDSRMNNLRTKWSNSVDKVEVMFVPKGTGSIQDLTPPVTEHIQWIRYLEDFFYQALGVPKVILGGTSGQVEASSKMSYQAYEQVWMKEIEELKADLLSQLGIEIDFNKPASLIDNLQSEGGKAKLGYQPQDIKA